MLDGLNIQYRPDLERVEVLFSIQPDTVEKLNSALEAGKLKHGSYGHWDGEKGAWFCGFLWLAGEEFEIGADHETGEIRLAAWPEVDPLDHTAPVDLSEQWVRFVSPMKRLMEILQ